MTPASPPKGVRIARRLEQVQPSATLVLAQRAREMQAQGLDVISLTAGEPDMPPAPHVIAAARAAMEQGKTRYTAVAGLPELRDAIARRILEEDGVAYTREQVMVSTGAKQAIYNALEALIDHGDEVLIVAPYWLSYRDMTCLAGGKPVILQTDESTGFTLSAEKLRAAITPRTRLLILNSPSNPAGAAYNKDQLRALAAVLEENRQILVLSDDIYRRISFDGGRAPSLLRVAPQLADRTVLINGCSKQFAMTGFRLGWAAAPREIIAAMCKVQGQSTSNAATPSQYAALAALDGDQGWVDEMVRTFDGRRKIAIELLRSIPGVDCFDPGGAFYLFPNFSRFFGLKLPSGSRIETADAISTYLLEKHLLATVPGSPFGSPRHLRLSFATDIETVKRGIERIAAAVREIA